MKIASSASFAADDAPPAPLAPKPPRILFIAIPDWLSTDRLPAELHRQGCAVAVLAPRSSFIAQSRHIDRVFALPRPFSGLSLRPRLEQVVRAWRPDRIVPVDEHVVRFLHALYRRRGRFGAPSSSLRSLIARSLGDPGQYGVVASRAACGALALRLGVRTPAVVSLSGPQDAPMAAARLGFPLAVKADGTVAGEGVRIVHNENELMAHLSAVGVTPTVRRLGRRLFGVLAGCYRAGHRRGPQTIVAQRCVTGQPALYVLAADRGAVLAGISFVKQCTHPGPTGPSSVVRYAPHPEMVESAHAVIAALGYSGFAGVDFIVEEGTGHAYFLELNPRSNVNIHFGKHVGIDVCAAYLAHLTGRPWDSTPGPVIHPLIAHFPKELARDPTSPYVVSAYHDVPADDPKLVAAYRRWLARHPRVTTKPPARQGAGAMAGAPRSPR